MSARPASCLPLCWCSGEGRSAPATPRVHPATGCRVGPFTCRSDALDGECAPPRVWFVRSFVNYPWSRLITYALSAPLVHAQNQDCGARGGRVLLSGGRPVEHAHGAAARLRDMVLASPDASPSSSHRPSFTGPWPSCSPPFPSSRSSPSTVSRRSESSPYSLSWGTAPKAASACLRAPSSPASSWSSSTPWSAGEPAGREDWRGCSARVCDFFV